MEDIIDPTKYKCKVHGVIESDAVHIQLPNEKTKHFCVRCLMEFIEKEIGQVEEIIDGKS